MEKYINPIPYLDEAKEFEMRIKVKIMCFNDDNGVKHIFTNDNTGSMCGKEKAALVRRNHNGKKTYILWRNIEAVSCKNAKSYISN